MPLNRLSQVFDTLSIRSLPNQTANLLDVIGTNGEQIASLTSTPFLMIGSGVPNVPLHIRNSNSSYSNPLSLNVPAVMAENLNNASGTANALLGARVGGVNGGDPFVSFDINGVIGWSIGLDNSDSDKFKISESWSDVGVRPAITLSPGSIFSLNSTSLNLGASSAAHQFAVVSNASTNVVSVFRGAASQTADVAQWQNSAGTSLTSINSSGHFLTPRINFTGGSTTISALTLADGTVSFEGTAGQLFSVSNSLTGTIFSINDISGLPSVEVTDLGIVKLNELYGQTVVGSGTPLSTSSLTVYPRTSSSRGLTVKGVSSQNADIFNVQSSTDTQFLKVDQSGNVYANPRLFVGVTSYVDAYRLYAVGSVTTEVVSVVRGASGQTANLQEWQNSTPTAVASISAAGALTLSSTISATGLAGSLLTSTVGTALGTAAAGTATVPARADHVHPTTGLGLTSGTLAQFAATTSAQLAGVISDETGSGALVFATSPTFTNAMFNNSNVTLVTTAATSITNAGQVNTLQIINAANAAGNDAFITFHNQGTFAVHFGLDRSTNRLAWGGWSAGANKYEIVDVSNTQTLTNKTFGSALALNYASPAITSNNASAASIFTSTVTSVTIGSSTIKTTEFPADGTTSTAAAAAGYMGLPQNSKSSAYTLAASDAGKHLYITTNGQTITIPANGTTAFPIGTTIIIVNANGVSTSIAITTDTLRLANSTSTGTRTLASNGMCTLLKVTATEWIASGNGLT